MQLKPVEAKEKKAKKESTNENPWFILGSKKQLDGPSKDAYCYEIDKANGEIILRFKMPEQLAHRETSTGKSYSILPAKVVNIDGVYESDKNRRLTIKFDMYTLNK